MMKDIRNKLFVIILLLGTSLFIFSDVKVAYALDCTYECDPGAVCAPKPTQILCPIFRIINFFFIIVGIVFAIMLGYGAIKLATSLGDPKGLQGATRAWFYAILGVFIVAGAYAILRILDSVFGIGYDFGSGPENIYNDIGDKLDDLLRNTFMIYE